MSQTQLPPLRVGFILLPLFTLNAFAGFIDSLRLAADKGGRSRQIHCSWQTMGPGPVTSSCGLEVHPQSSYRDPCHFTHIAVCGGNNYLDPHEDKALSDYLKDASRKRPYRLYHRADRGAPMVATLRVERPAPRSCHRETAPWPPGRGRPR